MNCLHVNASHGPSELEEKGQDLVSRHGVVTEKIIFVHLTLLNCSMGRLDDNN